MATLNCLFCSESFETVEDINRHIFSTHPEKVSNPESLGKAMAAAVNQQARQQLASALTQIVIGTQGSTIDKVLEIFREIYSRIGEWV